jgi:hypothetical protein
VDSKFQGGVGHKSRSKALTRTVSVFAALAVGIGLAVAGQPSQQSPVTTSPPAATEPTPVDTVPADTTTSSEDRRASDELRAARAAAYMLCKSIYPRTLDMLEGTRDSCVEDILSGGDGIVPAG